MQFSLFDDHTRFRLLPLTHTRPVAEIRCGILTMRARWGMLLDKELYTFTEDYLRPLFPRAAGTGHVLINAAAFATRALADEVLALQPGESLVQEGVLIACRIHDLPETWAPDALQTAADSARAPVAAVTLLQHVWDIFRLNDAALRTDFTLVTANRQSEPVPEHVTVSGSAHLFIEPGAVVHPCIINASAGPVYIGRDAEIMEGCLLRGPLALGEGAVLKMGAKVYGASSFGPGCKAGGELSNVVFFEQSNKGHDGFLGNSVIGAWCNLGADTNASNLKNNYDGVKIWDEHTGHPVDTGLQFCGLIMGDHSKCGINTMFNTGTVAGVSANIYGAGFPEKFIPSFSWGGAEGMSAYRFDRAMETAARMMARRDRELSDAEREMYRHIHDRTAPQRSRYS